MLEQIVYYFRTHLSVIIFCGIAIPLVTCFLLVLSSFATKLHRSRKEADGIKLSMAVLLLIFEVVLLFLFLWAGILGMVGYYEFFSMLFFLSIILVACMYAWKKGTSE